MVAGFNVVFIDAVVNNVGFVFSCFRPDDATKSKQCGALPELVFDVVAKYGNVVHLARCFPAIDCDVDLAFR